MNTYDDCSFCKGRVTEKHIQKACWWGEKLIAIVDNVPTGVCEQCGEKYYKASVLKEIESRIKSQNFDGITHIPFADFAKV